MKLPPLAPYSARGLRDCHVAPNGVGSHRPSTTQRSFPFFWSHCGPSVVSSRIHNMQVHSQLRCLNLALVITLRIARHTFPRVIQELQISSGFNSIRCQKFSGHAAHLQIVPKYPEPLLPLLLVEYGNPLKERSELRKVFVKQQSKLQPPPIHYVSRAPQKSPACVHVNKGPVRAKLLDIWDDSPEVTHWITNLNRQRRIADVFWLHLCRKKIGRSLSPAGHVEAHNSSMLSHKTPYP
mmetsp:Transcript_39450/g.156655  ORF Transcript_39450/g.156655 Transcript_39450/m.156655 type:complete len:238 (+) Transcript_39450:1908-2621(+)